MPRKVEISGARRGNRFDKWESLLLRDFETADGPEEVFALLNAGYWGNSGQIIIRVRNGRATLTFHRVGGRHREHALTGNELNRLRKFIQSNRIDELGPCYTPAVDDGIQHEYLHITRTGARRVFMNSAWGAGVYGELVSLFQTMYKSRQATVHYEAASEVSGLEVIAADDNSHVLAVWKKGSEMRVLLRTGSTAVQWYRLQNGSLGRRTARPSERPFPIIGHNTENLLVYDHLITRWQARTGDDLIIPGWRDGSPGVWRCGKTSRPIKIRSGQYAHPVVTPDGKWVVAAKSRGVWRNPNDIVRINLATGEELTIDVPPADSFRPLGYLATHGKVVLKRSRDPRVPGITPIAGPKKVEHYLLDPATGKTELLFGDHRPFRTMFRSPVQFNRQNVAWTWVNKEDAAEIGLYDLMTFRFDRVLSIPSISIHDLWIDGEWFYFVYHGQVLRAPIPVIESAL